MQKKSCAEQMLLFTCQSEIPPLARDHTGTLNVLVTGFDRSLHRTLCKSSMIPGGTKTGSVMQSGGVT